jgi:glycosyltransferase involved in cell wall biosynthesis
VKTLLILSQTFVPDPASVGQHIADVAIEMVRRGYRVVVYTSARGYDDPTIEYVKYENLHGVEVHRLDFSSFGKKSIATRVLGTASFMLQSMFVSLTTPNLGGIFFSTSPPLIGTAAVLARWVRRVPIAYWAMDLNPDQLIAMGKLGPNDIVTRVLEFANKIILDESSLVVALDRFMGDRLRDRANMKSKMQIMPPWPHEEHLEPLPHDQNTFRSAHGLDGKFVVMYSGNHSPANPLRTLLDATLVYKDDPGIKFLFIGGGLGKKEVEEHIQAYGLTNVVSMPYQPMSQLRYSLSAADVHVVSLGENMVGIVHPCKIYGAMAVGRPILYLGPKPSHVSDLLDEHDLGLSVSHGDVDGTVSAIDRLRALAPEKRAAMGQTAQRVMAERLSQKILSTRFCDYLEQVLEGREVTAPSANAFETS